MQGLTNRAVIVTGSFWSPRLAVNAKKAIFQPWKQLEATGRRPRTFSQRRLIPLHCVRNSCPIRRGDVSSFVPAPWIPGR